MLVLTRTEGETIVLHSEGKILARVTVVRSGFKVRLGITAPGEVEVDREEIFKRIIAEGRHRDEFDADEVPQL